MDEARSGSGVGQERGAHAGENVFLVGLMGAGKTSIGRLLAKRLGKAFFDSDQEIERATGVRIPVIFEIEGEAGFRAREARMLSELVRGGNIVLATGGGAVLSPQNRKLLAENGIVIYLRAAVADLWNRTRHDRNRPLLRSGEPLATLERLYAERDPLYREVAHIIIDTGDQSPGSLVHRLERRLGEFEAGAARPSDSPAPAG
ncbi:MAG TPA: shikimate kinase [Burkholderiales bacterium]|nr:shikimate kinase [Burkholderiales bacterium]